MTTLHERLRKATEAEHLALEQALAIDSRLHDRADVTLILARFYGFFEPLEEALAALLGAEGMTGRRRLDELGHDLRALGLSEAELARLSRSPDAGLLDGRGEALGALYVTEGARLGGRLIGRRLSEMDWIPAEGLRFWSDDPRSGNLWQSYLKCLGEPESEAMAHSVCTGAKATFGRLYRWLAVGGVF